MSDEAPQTNKDFADAFATASANAGAALPDAVDQQIPPQPDPAPAASETPAGDVGAAPAEAPAAPAEGAAQPPAAPEPQAGDNGAGVKADNAGTPPPAPASEAGAPAAEPKVDEVLSRLADIMERKSETPAAPAGAAAAEEVAPIYTQDELAVLTDFQKNWPDVAQAIDLQKRAEYQDLIKFTFESVASYLAPHLDQLKAIGNAVHLSEVKAEVPNYSPELEAQVMAWVENEPPYLQAAYKQVMQAGTSEEVADLFRRYQGATGGAPPVQQGAPAAPAATAPAAPVRTELSDVAKQAAEALAPVGTERTNVPQGSDPMDFKSAFRQFAEQGVNA